MASIALSFDTKDEDDMNEYRRITNGHKIASSYACAHVDVYEKLRHIKKYGLHKEDGASMQSGEIVEYIFDFFNESFEEALALAEYLD